MHTPYLKPVHRRMIFAGLILAAAVALGSYALMTGPRGPLSTGVALVGGPFSMFNHKGETVSEKTFAGKPMLLFFGYTYCPDVCPTELQVMAAALDVLGAKGQTIQPIFVTTDPARDTPEVLAAYVSYFSPRLVGLTGTAEQVAAMAKAYRVYYQKVDNPKSPEDYLMDHTSIIYLMGADGKFLKHFAYSTDATALAEGIAKALE